MSPRHMGPFARAVIAATTALLLGGCGGSGAVDEAGGTPDANTGSEGPAPGDIPAGTGGASTGSGGENGSGGADGGANGGANGGADGGANGGGGNGSGGSGGVDEPTVEVAGPTLDNDYPEYFGNIYLGETSKCANFSNDAPYPVGIESVSVGSPLVITPGCQPHSLEPAAQTCRAGVVLPAARAGRCTVGVAFGSSVDLSLNYELSLSWRLSTECTDTAAPPCSDPLVAEQSPSRSDPVEATWVLTVPLRYCGATDYADDVGNPGGTGSSPEHGCSAEPAPSGESPTDSPESPASPESPHTSESPSASEAPTSPDDTATPSSESSTAAPTPTG